MAESSCPYCGTAILTATKRCPQCNAGLLWQEADERLRDELKEREVNRGRATFTLIDEVVRAAKGGQPVSVAALKGFAFAWLFPRAMIVIGSVITGIVLIVQTLILWQQSNVMQDQTKLLVGQTAAAQLEHAEKLRARIDLLDALSARMSYATLRIAPHDRYCDEGACLESKIPFHILLAGNAKLAQANGPDGAATRALLDLVRGLNDNLSKVSRIKSSTTLVYRDTNEPEANPKFSAAEAAEALLQEAERRCAHPDAKDRSLFAGIRTLSELSLLLDPGIPEPDVSGDAKDFWPDNWRARAFDVGHLLSPTDNAAVPQQGLKPMTAEERRGMMTVAVLAERIAAIRAAAEKQLSDAHLTCTNRNREDRASLELIEASARALLVEVAPAAAPAAASSGR